MTAQQTTPGSMSSMAGAFLLVAGFLTLFSNLEAAATQATGNTVLEALPALVLALLHGLRAYVFDHAGFLSGVLQFLVSFWPLILILAGALLLRNVFRGVPAYKPGVGSSGARGANA